MPEIVTIDYQTPNEEKSLWKCCGKAVEIECTLGEGIVKAFWAIVRNFNNSLECTGYAIKGYGEK